MDRIDIELDGGSVVQAFRHEIDRIKNTPVTSFPANPGTKLVCHDEDPGELYFKPVLGWVVSGNGEIRPALAHGIFDDEFEAWVVQTADGVVTDQNAGWWPNLDAYRAYNLDRHSPL